MPARSVFRPAWVRYAFSLLLLVAVAALTGCNLTGVTALRGGRGEYAEAIQQTSNEQLLLNLVRLRYRDPPAFFEVASVAASFERSSGLGANVTLPELPNANNVYGATGTLSFSERPTVCYVPMQSERFAKQMMTPVTIESLLLLGQSGWSLRRIFTLCVQRVNGLQNAPRASGPTPTWAPEYEPFQRAVLLMNVLQVHEALYLDVEPQPAGPARIALRVNPTPACEKELAEFRALLGLGADVDTFPVVQARHSREPNTIALTTRSVLAAMHFLSQGVEVPARHVEQGKVTVTRDFKTREVFDWQRVLAETFRVHCRNSRPDQAAVAVCYRGAWFFIDDADLDSKSTFGALTQFMALQAGDVRATGPVLTLPVAK
jgi:hypothetical protein